MKYDISVISSYALSTLTCPLRWTVHSVYRKTVNLQAGSRLLALQAASSPVSPISLVTLLDAQEFNGLGIMAGQPAAVDGTLLRIGGEGHGSSVSFDWKESAVFESLAGDDGGGISLHTDSHAPLIRQALELADTGGFRMLFVPGLQDIQDNEDNGFLINAAAQRRLQACTSALKRRDYEAAAGELSGLIGLGIGLTPSGDDFLCGVLAGLLLSGRRDDPLFSALRIKIRENLSGTNDISRAFLQCALDYHFSRSIKELPTAATAGDICRSFGEIGHSSGMDTLCGVLFALLCP